MGRSQISRSMVLGAFLGLCVFALPSKGEQISHLNTGNTETWSTEAPGEEWVSVGPHGILLNNNDVISG